MTSRLLFIVRAPNVEVTRCALTALVHVCVICIGHGEGVISQILAFLRSVSDAFTLSVTKMLFFEIPPSPNAFRGFGENLASFCNEYSNVYIQQDATLHSLFYLETALHVSGGTTTTHHQERKQLYLQHLVFVISLLLFAAIVEELELRSSNSSTIAADSSNGVTNTRCCRYSCSRS